MRKISKNPIRLLKIKADRALQDWFRREYLKKLCECGCGRKFDLMHHHNEKSKSNAGRYNHDNLVFLSKFCHDSLMYSNVVRDRYILRKGEDWLKRMILLAREKMSPFSIKELKEFIKIYAQD